MGSSSEKWSFSQAPAALLASHCSIQQVATTLNWKGGCKNTPAHDSKSKPTSMIKSDNKNRNYSKISCKCNGMQGQLNFCHLHIYTPSLSPNRGTHVALTHYLLKEYRLDSRA